jgi:hypothetical protein
MSEIKLIGSRFTKISAFRSPAFSGEITTKTNIKITELSIVKESKNTTQIQYVFDIDYGELGKIELEGMIYIETDSKTQKELQKSWDNKKIENSDFVIITNIIIQKASLKAFELEDELGLPIHIRLPRINLKE